VDSCVLDRALFLSKPLVAARLRFKRTLEGPLARVDAQMVVEIVELREHPVTAFEVAFHDLPDAFGAACAELVDSELVGARSWQLLDFAEITQAKAAFELVCKKVITSAHLDVFSVCGHLGSQQLVTDIVEADLLPAPIGIQDVLGVINGIPDSSVLSVSEGLCERDHHR